MLSATWSGVAADSGWTARGVAPDTPLADYRYLSFYLSELDSSDPGDALFSMTLYSGAATGLSVTLPLERGSAWQEYTVDLQRSELYAGNLLIESATVVIDPSEAVFDALSIQAVPQPCATAQSRDRRKHIKIYTCRTACAMLM